MERRYRIGVLVWLAVMLLLFGCGVFKAGPPTPLESKAAAKILVGRFVTVAPGDQQKVLQGLDAAIAMAHGDRPEVVMKALPGLMPAGYEDVGELLVSIVHERVDLAGDPQAEDTVRAYLVAVLEGARDAIAAQGPAPTLYAMP